MLDVTKKWPPADYVEVFAQRGKRIRYYRRHPDKLAALWEYYKDGHCVEFIQDWGVLFEPRDVFDPSGTTSALVPFVMFPKQIEFVEFVLSLLRDQENGLCEKSRDMGATWLCVWISIYLWLFFDGAQIGWGSQEAADVDHLKNPSSIFEKMRIGIRNLPDFLKPEGFNPKKDMTEMRITNPATGAAIIGDAGDDIGRGGRTLIYFKDESAHYTHPERTDAALSQNTRVQLDVSSVYGTNTLFHRRRDAGVEWSRSITSYPRGAVRVLVMDWRDHPGKDQAWYDAQRRKHEAEGTLHILAQEVDRDYAAAVEGVIIPPQWVAAAVDSHVGLGVAEEGPYCAGLDIADEGGDLSALVARRGAVLVHAEEWGDMDTGATARRAIAVCQAMGEMELEYDAGGGWGAAVKAEYNRLRDEGQMPKGIFLVPWNPGGSVMDPERHIIPGDRQSPKNKDFFQNFRAQAWWALRRRFEVTYMALTVDGYTWDTDDIISIPSSLPNRFKLMKQLSQPVWTRSSSLKLMVDKKPDGAKSPDMGDATVMCYFPARAVRPIRVPSNVMDWSRRPSLRHRFGRKSL